MEDVQQRRERLAAMREQAAVEDGSDTTALKTVPASSFVLSNPVLEELPVPAFGKNHSSGFDFYTDPLTAYTGVKRRIPPDAGVYGRASSFQPGSSGTGLPPVSNNPPLRPPPPHMWRPGWKPIPYNPLLGAPGAHPSFSTVQPRNFSNLSDGRGMDMGFGGGGGNRGSGMHRSVRGSGTYGNSFHGQGRGYGRSNSNSLNYGSGPSYTGGNYSRDFQRGRSQGSGGRREGKTPSARDQPHMYYKKSMIEDPWKTLEEKLTTFKG